MKYPGKSGSFKLGPWPKGINNVKGEEHLDASELRDSVNFVYDDMGQAETRPGLVNRISGSSVFGLFQVNEYEGVYFDAGTLYKFDVRTWESTALASGYSINRRVSYVIIGERLYFTNGSEHGRIDLSTWAVQDGFGTPTPTVSVSLTALAYGSLAAGTYIVGMTFADERGEESACPDLHFITLEAVGGINISWTGAIPANVAEIRLYMTGAGGQRDELQRVYVADADDSSAQVTVNEFGSALSVLFKEVIPVPSLITAYNGYLYFALGRRVYHSDGMNYGLYHEDHNEVGSYEEEVSVLERGVDGLWIVAEKTYAYVGEAPEKFILIDNVFNFPAVKFSGKQVEGRLFASDNMPQGDVPYWFSSRGAVLGLTGGKVFPIMKGKAEPDRYDVGASGTVQYDGITSVVTALDEYRGPNDSVTLQDTFSVRVVNRGITV